MHADARTRTSSRPASAESARSSPLPQDPVPVISQLAQRLKLQRELSGNPATGLMFPSPTGGAINLDALAVGVVRPTLEKAGLHGTVGMLLGAGLLQTFTDWVFQMRRSSAFCATQRWRSHRTAISKRQMLTPLQRCGHSKMHLICTSGFQSRGR